MKNLYIQLFLGRPCICKPKKCHSSPQKSKPRAGACLEVGRLDQSQIRILQARPCWALIGPNFHLQGKLRGWVLSSVMSYAAQKAYLYRVYPKITEHYRVSQMTQPMVHLIKNLVSTTFSVFWSISLDTLVTLKLIFNLDYKCIHMYGRNLTSTGLDGCSNSSILPIRS